MVFGTRHGNHLFQNITSTLPWQKVTTKEEKRQNRERKAKERARIKQKKEARRLGNGLLRALANRPWPAFSRRPSKNVRGPGEDDGSQHYLISRMTCSRNYRKKVEMKAISITLPTWRRSPKTSSPRQRICSWLLTKVMLRLLRYTRPDWGN